MLSLSKRNFLIGATASLGIIAAPAIVRCESLMAIKSIEDVAKNERYVTFLEAIYPGMSPLWYNHKIWNGPDNQQIEIKPHMFNVNKLNDFMCAKMATPV